MRRHRPLIKLLPIGSDDLTVWSGVLLGNDSFIDEQGDQEVTFQRYYTLLKKFIEPNLGIKVTNLENKVESSPKAK